MTEPDGFSMKARAKSFSYAGRGVVALVREQHNARIHLVATVVVIAGAACFRVSRLEWCALLLAIAIVWGAEALNTAIEHLADAAVPERHPLVGKAKDAAAGGVLLCAIGAALVAGVIFLPHLSAWLAA